MNFENVLDALLRAYFPSELNYFEEDEPIRLQKSTILRALLLNLVSEMVKEIEQLKVENKALWEIQLGISSISEISLSALGEVIQSLEDNK
jgi:hypothetical protein